MKKCWAGKEEKHIRMQAKDKLCEASLITQSQILLRYNTGKNPIFPSRCFPRLWLWRRLAPSLTHPLAYSLEHLHPAPSAWGCPPATTPKRRLREEINAVCGCTTFHFITSSSLLSKGFQMSPQNFECFWKSWLNLQNIRGDKVQGKNRSRIALGCTSHFPCFLQVGCP